MKIYIVWHNIMCEGSDVVGIYATQSKADAEALRCNNEAIALRQASWNSLSKKDKAQGLYGHQEDYLEAEYWSVEEYEVIEGE